MNSLALALRRLDGDLNRVGVRWALIGGLAVSVRAEPRFTRDVDVAVAIDSDAEAEAVARSMMSNGYEVLATVEQEATGRLATVRLVPPVPDVRSVVVDLLFASSGIEPELVDSAELREIDLGLVIPVARTGHLIALKLLARDDEHRPLDAADLLALRAVADEVEWVRAQEAVELITARGYHRGRDLVVALDVLRSGRSAS